MLFRRTDPPEHLPFAALPVTRLRTGSAGREIAVHVRGALSSPRKPLVALAGYHRNMTDFTTLLSQLGSLVDASQPVVLIDLAGRGRSDPLPKRQAYATPVDVDDVWAVMDALALRKPVVLGSGHGGQVALLMSVRRPGALGGVVLVDAGPVADSRGLVRLRNNLRHIETLKSAMPAREAMRRVLATDYPSADTAQLNALAERVFRFDIRNRVTPLFDRRLVARLDAFGFDDIFEPQWPMFDSLVGTPLMLVRTQLSDLLRRETFGEMAKRRPDAATLLIEGQGSPALFDTPEIVRPIAEFLTRG